VRIKKPGNIFDVPRRRFSTRGGAAYFFLVAAFLAGAFLAVLVVHAHFLQAIVFSLKRTVNGHHPLTTFA